MEENCVCAPHIMLINMGVQGRNICISDLLLVLLWLNQHIILSDVHGWLAHLVS